jgi:hypothetical protein
MSETWLCGVLRDSLAPSEIECLSVFVELARRVASARFHPPSVENFGRFSKDIVV